jgi:hypothetical protein
MNRELAQMVLNSAIRASVELANLPPLLKEHGEAGKAEPIKLAIASAIHEIGLIQERVFSEHPDLKNEYASRLSVYGRSYL